MIRNADPVKIETVRVDYPYLDCSFVAVSQNSHRTMPKVPQIGTSSAYAS